MLHYPAHDISMSSFERTRQPDSFVLVQGCLREWRMHHVDHHAAGHQDSGGLLLEIVFRMSSPVETAQLLRFTYCTQIVKARLIRIFDSLKPNQDVFVQLAAAPAVRAVPGLRVSADFWKGVWLRRWQRKGRP